MISVTTSARTLEGVQRPEPDCSLGYECDDTTHDGTCGEPKRERLWIAAPGEAIPATLSTGASIEFGTGHPPEWMVAASQPCPTCWDDPTVDRLLRSTQPCPGCVDGKPLIELRVPCPSASSCLAAINWHNIRGGPEPECPCDERQDVTVSAGVWKVIDGPWQIVDADQTLPPGWKTNSAEMWLSARTGACWIEEGGACDRWKQSIDVTHLGDPASLVESWACLLERVR